MVFKGCILFNQYPACLSDNALNIAYFVLPTIPLLLLLIVATGVFCFKLFTKRCVVSLISSLKKACHFKFDSKKHNLCLQEERTDWDPSKWSRILGRWRKKQPEPWRLQGHPKAAWIRPGRHTPWHQKHFLSGFFSRHSTWRLWQPGRPGHWKWFCDTGQHWERLCDQRYVWHAARPWKREILQRPRMDGWVIWLLI